MTLFSAFTETLTWVLDTLFGPIHPIFNPLVDDRQPAAPGPLLASSPTTTLLPHNPLRRGLFHGWKSSRRPANFSVPKSDIWQPAIVDVIHARELLQTGSNGQLPNEVINMILDYAEYWPHVSASKSYTIVARGNSSHEDVLVVRTPPICALATAGCEDDSRGLPEPTLLHPARKVVFRIHSHDQGYSQEAAETQGTYEASYTWFDTEIDEEFGPMPSDEPLSRIPWELSSTKFLYDRPQNRHRQESKKNSKERIRDEMRKSSEVFHTQEADSQSDHLAEVPPSAKDQPNESNNPEHPELPKPRLFSHRWLQDHKYEVQYNVQAKREVTEHTIIWRHTDNVQEDSPEAAELQRIGRGRATGDGRFVRSLVLGDCVSLWAKARHPQWLNTVESATVEVYFAI